MAAPEEADFGWEKDWIGFLVVQGYVGLICAAYISRKNWSCACSERQERLNSERRLRMRLEMEEEEDAKQIVAVGKGGLLGVCFRAETDRVTCAAIQGVLLRREREKALEREDGRETNRQ